MFSLLDSPGDSRKSIKSPVLQISDETKNSFVWPGKRLSITPFTHAHNNSKG